MKAYMNSKTPESWKDRRATPPDLVTRIQQETGLIVRHDVCAEPTTAKAASYWTVQNNALKIGWARQVSLYPELYNWLPLRSAMFLNPPYSDPTEWVRKACLEASRGVTVIGVLPDDRSARWYQNYVENQAIMLLVPDRRVSFLMKGKPQNGNPKGTVIPIWMPTMGGHTIEKRFSLDVLAKPDISDTIIL